MTGGPDEPTKARVRSRAPRPTMHDVATAAGVSVGAVSYALNGRPGVSETTRARVLAIAAELGWAANQAARSLRGGGTNTVGLVIARPAETLGVETYYMQLIAGLEETLAANDFDLLLRVVADVDAEARIYRGWGASERVDGIIVVDPRTEDPRLEVVVETGLRAVVLGDAPDRPEVSSVVVDHGGATADAVRYLQAIGHRRITRVAGPEHLRHVSARDRAFEDTAHELGVESSIIRTDFTAESGASATRRILARADRPTAVIYDNDVMAAAALPVAAEFSLAVPHDLSILSWEDSMLCQLATPPITAIRRDVRAFGALVAEALLDQIRTGRPVRLDAARPELLPRASTAPRTLP
ncbi:LacI family transcriptional regulator [Plantibacter sp. MCCC 1A11337]|uniref:LacI family DNA-binding transcriptional regulator n=1 Tax=Plantibacter TaxID=190323 RepID=UPI0007D98FA8|nr:MULTISPECIES: LacI family DNA-binding transcriptional regulator [Plantibacter]AQX78968.1 LacI family transcriptional regulator [Plantibacter flavus]NUJ88376.1 LacI family transcriptional regulator [Plantibacter sp. MCCC 1A11337]OAN30868.1 hypothetical protein A4X17_04735 [Plantibacter sp. H53]OII39916.1 hypothetical protein BIU99_05640 [Plantibacter sp. MMLR14_011]